MRSRRATSRAKRAPAQVVQLQPFRFSLDKFSGEIVGVPTRPNAARKTPAPPVTSQLELMESFVRTWGGRTLRESPKGGWEWFVPGSTPERKNVYIAGAISNGWWFDGPVLGVVVATCKEHGQFYAPDHFKSQTFGRLAFCQTCGVPRPARPAKAMRTPVQKKPSVKPDDRGFVGRYRFLGISDAHTECERCGRRNLKHTFGVQGDDGRVAYLGSECASLVTELSERDVELLSRGASTTRPNAATGKRASRSALGPRVVRLFEVVDTREREERDGRFSSYMVGIPGTGILNECHRCGKTHEVHAHVQLEDGSHVVMGTGCARRDAVAAGDEKLARSILTAERRAMKVAAARAEVDRLASRVAGLEASLREYIAMPRPDPTWTVVGEHPDGRPKYEVRYGDAESCSTFDAPGARPPMGVDPSSPHRQKLFREFLRCAMWKWEEAEIARRGISNQEVYRAREDLADAKRRLEKLLAPLR